MARDCSAQHHGGQRNAPLRGQRTQLSKGLVVGHKHSHVCQRVNRCLQTRVGNGSHKLRVPQCLQRLAGYRGRNQHRVGHVHNAVCSRHRRKHPRAANAKGRTHVVAVVDVQAQQRTERGASKRAWPWRCVWERHSRDNVVLEQLHEQCGVGAQSLHHCRCELGKGRVCRRKERVRARCRHNVCDFCRRPHEPSQRAVHRRVGYVREQRLLRCNHRIE